MELDIPTLKLPARAKQSAILRKSTSFINQLPRSIVRTVSKSIVYEDQPVVVANSFPKSGTHLLIQILEGLGNENYGTFWASTPSLTLKERSSQRMAQSIRLSAPGELASAHLFYSAEVVDAFRAVNAVHFFIYRDPRDVVVSEAHYLTYMNRWHRLHSRFAELPSDEQRITLSICGLPATSSVKYPNIYFRFERYSGWLSDEHTCLLKFEDLIGAKRQRHITRITDHYLTYRHHFTSQSERERLQNEAIRNIAPSKSHTFHEGKRGGWRTKFTKKHKDLFKEIAGGLLIDLGYEQNLDW